MRPIIELLSDYTGAEQEQRVRTNACVALGAVATSEAMEHLFRLGLTDASEEVRESAAREIAKAPSQLRTPLIHRLYDGSEKRGEWRSNFELLQSIGAISGKLEPRPGDWLRRVLQILVLNFRIIATRGSEFSFWPRLKLGSLFVALFCSAIVVTIWSLLAFESLFDEDWAAVLAMIFGLWIPFVVYPVVVTMVPSRFAFSQREAAFADVLWFFILFVCGYLIISATAGELAVPGGSVLAEFMSWFLFYFVPIAVARICLDFARAPVPRMPYLVRCLATGLGGATVSVWIVMLTTDRAGPFSEMASISLPVALCTVFFLCWIRALQGAPPAPAADASKAKPLSALPALCLGLITLVTLFFVSVPRSELVTLGSKPTSFAREMAHGQRLNLEATNPGVLEITLNAKGADPIIWLDSRRVDNGGRSEPETLVQSISPGRRYTVKAMIYSGGTILWKLDSRVAAWVSLTDRTPANIGKGGPGPDPETMTLELKWSPRAKSKKTAMQSPGGD